MMETFPEAPAESVTAALREAADLGSFFSLAVAGPDAGWHPVSDDYARGFPDLIAAACARYDTAQQRIGASIVQLGHAARLWSPVLSCVLTHGIVLDLTGLQRADNGPELRIPEPVGHLAGPEQVEVLYRSVVVDHLEAFAAGLNVKVAPGLLYGNAASALAEAARAIRAAKPGLTDAVTGLAEKLLATGELAGTGGFVNEELAFRRRGCCLYYRVPGGTKCDDCGLA